MLKKIIFVAEGTNKSKEVGNSKCLGDHGRLRMRTLTGKLIEHINGSTVRIMAADVRLPRASAIVIARELGAPDPTFHRELNFPGGLSAQELDEKVLSSIREKSEECEVLIACSPTLLVDHFLKLYADRHGLRVNLEGKLGPSTARALDVATGEVKNIDLS